MDNTNELLNTIELCPNPICDRGQVITDRVTPEGKFELDPCPECEGRGFRTKGE